MFAIFKSFHSKGSIAVIFTIYLIAPSQLHFFSALSALCVNSSCTVWKSLVILPLVKPSFVTNKHSLHMHLIGYAPLLKHSWDCSVYTIERTNECNTIYQLYCKSLPLQKLWRNLMTYARRKIEKSTHS